jgi:predicted dehydrogenase
VAKIRVGILGAGSMGRTHGQRVAEQRGAEVVAICSRTLASAEALSEELTGGAATATDDFDRMLADGKLDALYVCLPPAAHAGEVEKAARQGIHLMLEKPLALTVRRASSMARAIRQAGVISHVGYHMRFAAPVRKLAGWIADGSAGTPVLFQGRFFCNALHGEWWRDVEQSGGQVFEQAIHVYDMAMHLLGRPERVCGFAANLTHTDVTDYTVDDNSVSILRFESGAMATIAASNSAEPMAWKGDFRVVCRNVSVEFEGLDRATFAWSGGEPAERFWQTGRDLRRRTIDKPTDCYLEQTREFLRAIAGKPSSLASVEEGLAGVKMVAGVLRSSAGNGKAVSL